MRYQLDLAGEDDWNITTRDLDLRVMKMGEGPSSHSTGSARITPHDSVPILPMRREDEVGWVPHGTLSGDQTKVAPGGNGAHGRLTDETG